MTERTCEYCGNTFRVQPSRIKHGRGRHCSKTCQYASAKAKPRRDVKFTCLCCGVAFSLSVSKASNKGAGKYCSRQCRDQHWVGENTPNWQHGGGVYKRGPRWYSTRRRILDRDKTCRQCGAEGGLHVHHIIPFRMFDNADDANSDNNLTSLCPPCHRLADSQFKWVATAEGSILRFNSGGYAWSLVREKGLI
jgi:5-methylcytosine-specific restriction endonuclease McrA